MRKEYIVSFCNREVFVGTAATLAGAKKLAEEHLNLNFSWISHAKAYQEMFTICCHGETVAEATVAQIMGIA